MSAGVLMMVTDFGVYYILFHFLSYGASKAISFTCAGALGYFINKLWTFERVLLPHHEIRRYLLVNLMVLGVNVLTNQSILDRWPSAVFLALFTASAVTSIVTFVSLKWWVYRAQIAQRS